MISNYITHYYVADRQPLLSLSELKPEDRDRVLNELVNRHKTSPGYHRRFGKDYIDRRRKTEDILRSNFIRRGGKPNRKYPFYFVLGESIWFKDLIENHSEIRIPIKELNPATVSFTFPDSYVALSYNSKPYHGKVFMLEELEDVINKYGLPIDDTSLNYEKYWIGDFEKYIEFQIWDDNIVKPFIDKFLEAKHKTEKL